jgi:hypothetical protein
MPVTCQETVTRGRLVRMVKRLPSISFQTPTVAPQLPRPTVVSW